MGDRIVRQVYHPTSLPPLYKNIGVYCRVSSGLSEQLHSLSAQVSAYVQMISSRWDYHLVDIYIDVCTGEKKDRPAFDRMLRDVDDGKLDVIITKSISRFGRNAEDTLIAVRRAKAKNVQLIFEEDNLDTYKNGSEFIISVLSAYAQAENESRRENQLWAIRKRVEDGTSELYLRRCYGYSKDQDGRLLINSAEAEVVQLIYSKYLEGYSIVGLQKMLREMQILSPSGNEAWSKKTIENVLTNEKYTGDVIVMKAKTSSKKGHKREPNTDGQKYMIQDFIPAIITKDMFDAVQEERKRRSNIETDESGTHRKKEKYSSKAAK